MLCQTSCEITLYSLSISSIFLLLDVRFKLVLLRDRQASPTTITLLFPTMDNLITQRGYVGYSRQVRMNYEIEQVGSRSRSSRKFEQLGAARTAAKLATDSAACTAARLHLPATDVSQKYKINTILLLFQII